MPIADFILKIKNLYRLRKTCRLLYLFELLREACKSTYRYRYLTTCLVMIILTCKSLAYRPTCYASHVSWSAFRTATQCKQPFELLQKVYLSTCSTRHVSWYAFWPAHKAFKLEYLSTCYTRQVILCTVPGNLLYAQEEDLVHQFLADGLRHLTNKSKYGTLRIFF